MSAHSLGEGGAHASHGAPNNAGATAALALAALGVVYGDIGTSPLYAIKECFARGHGVDPTPGNVLGVLSLVAWSLILVVVVKYISFILRADNRGEGGILALLALVVPHGGAARKTSVLVLLGLFGAALLYGDGMITPAISVLSAVEGLEVATSTLKPYVVPITVVILVALFAVQSRGTAGIGRVFGPITLLWFASIAAIGLVWVLRRPEVLYALDPRNAVRFFAEHKLHGAKLLGSVVLCVTGGEALYADMGHFGKRPIRLAWYGVVFPALLASYFGQGAALLSRGDAIRDNPFFGTVPSIALIPMVILATAATVIASQALISGAFSLTQQAVQLGYCPRVEIVHTSAHAEGQIYIPEVNRILMVACVALVLAFRESTRLAAAYGIAVTGTMAITSILFFQLTRQWKWPLWKSLGLVSLFLVVDVAFLAANVVKIADGGWVPIVVALAVLAVMTTWKAGRAVLAERILASTLPLQQLLDDIEQNPPPRVPGTAVFMTSNPEGAPPVLLHHLKHNKSLHQRVILLSVKSVHVPTVPESQCVERKELSAGFTQIVASYGFMQSPDMREIFRLASTPELELSAYSVSFYLGRETLLPSKRGALSRWRAALFALLSRNARPATMFFRIPPSRVVELGMQVEL
ncbi:MAG: potassium transporter Kup [Myxococcales bacterium]|nr:potassium transporter Kup [Myxococcales bacterium]